MRNVISSQLEIGQVDIANIVIDVTSRDDIPLILLGLQHIYTTGPLTHLRHFYLSKLLIYRSHKIFIKKAPLKSKVFFLRLL